MRINRILIHVLLLIVLFSCNKDNEFEFALIQTGDVTNIDSTGATFHARISDLSNSNILEYGFVWDTSDNPEIGYSEKYVISGSPGTGIISERISTALEEGVSYNVRAYARNSKYVTYGKEVAFTSLGSGAPSIIDFYPKAGNINDTLYILGKNFSCITGNNKVLFGNHQSEVLNASQDTLVVIVPDELDTQASLINVSIFGNEAVSNESFNLVLPEISDFMDKTGTFGSQITITGNNFLSDKESLKVFFDNYQAEITNTENESLTVIVPDSLNVRKCIITVSMNNLNVNTTDSFTLEPINIIDFSPKIIITGETIILTGNNFSPIPENNYVKIGGIEAEVINASMDELGVTVPLQDKGIYPDRKVSVSVEVAEDKKSYSEPLLINDQWFRRTDYPLDSELGLKALVINDKAYVGGLNWNNTLHKFNPENNEWDQLAAFPGKIRYGGVAIVINNKLYFGTGSNSFDSFNDFWEYDPNSDIWTEKKEVPGPTRYFATGFSIQNCGYVGAGRFSDRLHDFYKYDPTVDEWSEIEPVPFAHEYGLYWGIQYAVGVTIQAEGYIGFGLCGIQGDINDQFWKYNPISSKWTRIDDFPVHAQYGHYGGIAYSYENEGFFKSKEYPDKLWKYNSTTGLWSEQCDVPSSMEGSGSCFCINGIAYFINGNNQLWEYNPNR